MSENINGEDLKTYLTPILFDYIEKIQQARNNVKRLRALRATVKSDDDLNEMQYENLKYAIDEKIEATTKKMLQRPPQK